MDSSIKIEWTSLFILLYTLFAKAFKVLPVKPEPEARIAKIASFDRFAVVFDASNSLLVTKV